MTNRHERRTPISAALCADMGEIGKPQREIIAPDPRPQEAPVPDREPVREPVREPERSPQPA